MRMHGEGNYQLTSVKDVKVSKDFLSLNIKDRNCQNETTLEDCKTKVYLLKVRNICQCFPFSIWSEQKVCLENLTFIILFCLNNIFNYIQSQLPICNKDGLICSERVREGLERECLNPCEGLYADIKKLPAENFETVPYKLLIKSYSKHSRFNESEYRIPSKLNSKYRFYRKSQINFLPFLVNPFRKDLKFVRIYFDTPTFDRVTRDKAAKFVDKLSAIGGTMGLLTGFSLISAIEIIYFTFKIITSFIRPK